MDEHMVPVSDAKGRLSALVREAEDADVLLMRYGRPAAVLVGVDRYEGMLEEHEDALDRLSIYESADSDARIPWEKLKIELGLD
ncbi:MAG: type II toxin-antitoxin system prevent-host-death family antitoxin [Nitriliruptorales bacterium]|nr:type II toxin-antitoxin system prevent-host-death family antitoxin [Nitriliruptorales bacterium]